MLRSIKHPVLLLVAASLLVLAMSGAALAAAWSDLPRSLLDDYGLTVDEVSAISQGFADGAWKPDQMITRAQFVKMSVEAFDVALADPATPSFTDVASDSLYYQYIEGARAAGLITGATATTFEPYEAMTHQQGYAIIVRWATKAGGIDAGGLGDAPAMAMGNLYQSTAHALDNAVHDDSATAGGYEDDRGGDSGDAIDPVGSTSRIEAAAALIRATRWIQTR